MALRYFPFNTNALQQQLRQSAQHLSNSAARLQAYVEQGNRLKLVRFTGDVAVAMATLAMQQSGHLKDAAMQAGASLGQAAQNGLFNGAATSAGIAALLNAHKYARGEQGLAQAVKAASREAMTGAGSGMAATLAAGGSKLALGALGAPFVAKAAAPVVAAAVAAWLAQEAGERGLAAAENWLCVPPHAFPETAPPETDPA